MLYRLRITPGRGGELRLRLPDDEQELLEMLCRELGERLDDPADPELRRLFPPAHEDPDADAEYRQMTGNQLVSGRARALSTVQSTLDRKTLSSDEAESWLTVLNDLRLVLGTRLDVSEEMDFDLDPADPRTPELAVYAYLSWLQEQLVEAIAANMGSS